MSEISITVTSARYSASFKVDRFREYRVDIDLESDSNGFDFVVKNPLGIYTSLFGRYDEVDIILNKVPVMKGRIDIVEYQWDDDDNYIHISGRDMAAPLVDNDAIPQTKQNVKPADYIKERCSEYGISKTKIDDIPIVDKLIIGTGETEISIMNNLLLDSRKRLWLIYDTMYSGDWSTDAAASYIFSRGGVGGGIPIKQLRLIEDATEQLSEVIIYGSMNSGENKVVGKAQNDWMIGAGVKKRKVKRSYNNDAVSKYASSALRDVRDGFRDNTSVELKVRTPETTVILPNKTARVIDQSITKMNSTFFVKSVSYTKDLTSGSNTDVVLVLGDSTFDVLWGGQGTKANGGVTGTPSMTEGDVLNTKKG